MRALCVDLERNRDGGENRPICSAKGCRTPAVWVLAWNNPKLHTRTAARRGVAVCDEHREHLSQFLGVRGFLKDVVPLAEWEAPEDSGRP
ncbi:Acetone carboxylase OS=Streptomyces tendae OX=1932 GN=GUR47_13465 PE=4 SV=1 [Streptomyces tendae]